MSVEEPPVETERSPKFPFSEWQEVVEGAVERLTGRMRHAGRNAFAHLRGAWRLHGVDDAMSAFRAITAEEEAATALMVALQRQRYPDAGRLNPWDHSHKVAFWALVSVVSDAFHKSGLVAPRVALSKKDKPRVTLHFDMTALAGQSGDSVWATPDEPFNFSMRSGDVGEMTVHRFEEELAALADARGGGTILKYLKREANTRNLLLYASDNGIPNVAFEDQMLIERAKRVCVLLVLTIAIAQTPMHQPFAVQCLEALLLALERVQGALQDHPELLAPSDRPLITIKREDGGPATVSISRTFDFQVTWLGVRGWPTAIGVTPSCISYDRQVGSI